MTVLILFGATGDLARRKLFPTLSKLQRHRKLPPDFSILAIGRRPYTAAEFRHAVAASEPELPLPDITYLQADYTSAATYQAVTERIASLSPDRALYYLAVPPADYGQITESLGASGLLKSSESVTYTLAIEKPFGQDLESARRLDQALQKWLPEDRIYRVDHYLGKEAVQNILAFRFANDLFQSVWNNRHIDHIQITAAETIGIENRAAYYDQTGAIRDLFQNHLLQLVTLLTIDEPSALSAEAITREERKILESLRVVPESVVLGQYDGYRDERGVAPDSTTETFVSAELSIDTERWRTVPIYVRAGKYLARNITEISVQFKEMGRQLFALQDARKASNVLSFRIQPEEGVSLRLIAKTPGENLVAQAVNMEFCYASGFHTRIPEAYERLLCDIIAGDTTLGLRSSIIEESWRIVDPIIERYKDTPRHTYVPGSWGPDASHTLLERSGRTWLAHESTVCNGIFVE